MKDDPKRRVSREELHRDPAAVVQRAATEGPLVIVDDEGNPQVYVSVPRDERPVRFD